MFFLLYSLMFTWYEYVNYKCSIYFRLGSFVNALRLAIRFCIISYPRLHLQDLRKFFHL